MSSEEARKAYEEGQHHLELAAYADYRSELFASLEDAVAAFERALAADPTHAEAWASKGYALHRLERPQEAAAALGEAVRLQPEDCYTRRRLADALAKLGRTAEALAAAEELLRRLPADAAAWVLKARAFTALGRHDEALLAWQQVLRLPPGNILEPGYCDLLIAQLGRAAALARTGHEVQAAAAYGTLLRENVQRLVGALAPVPFLDALRELEPARAAFVEFVESTSDPVLRHRAGDAYLRSTRGEDALPLYEALIASDPADHRAWYGKAEALVQIGRKADAITAFEKSLELKPDFTPAAARLEVVRKSESP